MPGKTQSPFGSLTIEIDPKRRALVVKARWLEGQDKRDLGFATCVTERSAEQCAHALASELVRYVAERLRKGKGS